MSHLVVPTANIIVINDNKILLSRRVNTGWMDGYLCLPGGHVESGETPLIAILREVKEELGVILNPRDIELVCVAMRKTGHSEHVGFEFKIINKDYQFINAEPEKCSELVWADLNHLPPKIIQDFKHIIMKGFLGEQQYLEIGY